MNNLVSYVLLSKMADQAVPQFFQNLSEQIRGVTTAIGTQSVSQIVQSFDGNPK